MAIVYRLQKGSRLTVEEIDGNFQHVQNYLTGLTASVSNLVSVVAGITASENTTVIAGLTASVDTLTTNLASATASIVNLQNALTGVTGDFNFLLLVGGVTQSGTFSFVDGVLGTYSV
jgi:hypothetical protein